MNFGRLISFLEENSISPIGIGETEYLTKLKSLQTEKFNSEDTKILSHLIQHGTIVYLQWIYNDKQLLDFLSGEMPSGIFKDGQKLFSHNFLKQFQAFTSPFAERSMLVLPDDLNTSSRYYVSSFFPLLSSDSRLVVEDKLTRSFFDTFKYDLILAEETKLESELTEIILPYLSDESLGLVSNLSRGMYDKKLYFVDSLLSVVNFRACTPRLANLIIKKAENIQLHTEHQTNIQDLRMELRKGNIRVKNVGKKAKFFSGRLLWIFLFLLVLILGGRYFFKNYDPFSDNGNHEEINKTAFTELNKADRKKIDSLIRTIQTEEINPEETAEIDPFIGMQLMDIVVQQTLSNELVQSSVQFSDTSIMKGLILKDSCEPTSKEMRQFIPLGYSDLKSKIGNLSLSFKNRSEYEIIILVFDNEANKGAFYKYLDKDETINFKLNKGENILFFVGNDIVNQKDKFISFCNVDANSLIATHNIFTVAKNSGSAKIIAFGSNVLPFKINDLNNVFK